MYLSLSAAIASSAVSYLFVIECHVQCLVCDCDSVFGSSNHGVKSSKDASMITPAIESSDSSAREDQIDRERERRVILSFYYCTIHRSVAVDRAMKMRRT